MNRDPMDSQCRPTSFLVVDDDEFMLKLISRTLQVLGHNQVLTCNSGAKALAQLNGKTLPEVILCDLNMPHMDGVELLRKLAGIGYDGAIVVISGEDSRILSTVENLARAHGLAILGFLEKPVEPEELGKILADLQSRPRTVASPRMAPFSPEEIQQGLSDREFVAFFQPKVEIATGRIVGVEALARWRHPARGMVGPDCFIGVAEQHGLIGTLTELMLSEALSQAQAWRRQGLALKVAINVSMEDLVQLDFPELVLEQAKAAGIPPVDITLEVTESGLMNNPVVPLDILTRLRLKRVGLSIDDFGTGYSSLTQLKNIPFDELKLDRSFVQDAGRDPTARAILESSVGLAKKLNMSVVAEGVETRDDWDLVAALGCDLAQGFFIAKPMPGPNVPAWLETWHAP